MCLWIDPSSGRRRIDPTRRPVHREAAVRERGCGGVSSAARRGRMAAEARMGALSIRAGETARGREGLMAGSGGRERAGGRGWRGKFCRQTSRAEGSGWRREDDDDSVGMGFGRYFLFFTDGIHFTTSVGVALTPKLQNSPMSAAPKILFPI